MFVREVCQLCVDVGEDIVFFNRTCLTGSGVSPPLWLYRNSLIDCRLIQDQDLEALRECLGEACHVVRGAFVHVFLSRLLLLECQHLIQVFENPVAVCFNTGSRFLEMGLDHVHHFLCCPATDVTDT